MGVWHPFTQMQGFVPRGEIVRAQGAWLTTASGHRVLDGISSWWVNIHGHAHPAIRRAIADQAGRFDQVILADFTHGPAARLSAKLAQVMPGDLEHTFLSDNGSTAVEVALKMALQAQQRRGCPERKRFVAFTGAYHGDTIGAMSVGERGVFNEPWWDLLFPVDTLPYDDLEALEKHLETHARTTAAVIMEPLIQGAAGMRFCRPEFVAGAAAVCRRHGVLLILDEVMTGWGHTGTLFACEQAGVVPDILCASKGITGGTLPLGLTVCRPEIYQLFLGSTKGEAFLHGHSYAGNPIACAAALASLDLFEEEQTLTRISRITEVYREAADAFRNLPAVTGVRVRGSVFAYEVSGGAGGYLDPVGRRIADRTFPAGLYTRPLGNTMYLMPPYCVTDDELRQALAVLLQATVDEASARQKLSRQSVLDPFA
jgi:adenosylmethionine---8-amino-7-oxononanoate aminotransferase